MTSWTARIDALLPYPEPPPDGSPERNNDRHMRRFNLTIASMALDRLALAAERMKEPHEWDCDVYVILNDGEGQPEHGGCTCGKDAELLRILEGR